MTDREAGEAAGTGCNAVIESSLRALVTVAFAEFASQRVLPPSIANRWIQAGRDYAGPDIMGLAEFKRCESLLDEHYPNRFGEPLAQKHAEFSLHYLLNFIEAAFRRCAESDNFDANDDGVTASILEMFDVLEAPEHSLAVVRAVSHVQTHDGGPLIIAGVEVVPETSRDDHDFLLGQCRRHVPGSGGAFNRELPFVFAHPHATLSVRSGTGTERDTFGTLRAASRQVDRFLLLLRLLTGTTADSHFEVQGPTTLVGPIHPTVYRYPHQESMPLVRRSAVLGGTFEAPLQALGSMIDSLQVKRENMAAASFDVAIDRFTASYEGDGLAIIVDLATALESILIDSADGNDGITSRLKHRAAALLATQDDTVANVFGDIGALYGLRSALVHGGNLSRTTLRNKVLGISTVTAKDWFGVAVAEAVDRMRDLVRRAILARICLASGEKPLWPFNPKTSLEVTFADDVRRAELRTAWRAVMGEIGALKAADHLLAPAQPMHEDYGRPNDE